MYLPDVPQRVVDVGGGYGLQAIMLARAGHTVAIVDLDPHMVDIARSLLAAEPGSIARRVSLVVGDGLRARELVGAEFDLACCHSVLAYEPDPAPLVAELVGLVRRGGLISIICIDRQAVAMRSALERRWSDALIALHTGRESRTADVGAVAHTRQQMGELLRDAGARVVGWQGIGIFTDHVSNRSDSDLEVMAAVEWIAGHRDPYRSVARCFHLIAERV